MTQSVKTFVPYFLVGSTLFGILAACIVQQDPTSMTGKSLRLEVASTRSEPEAPLFNNDTVNDLNPERQSEPTIAPVQAASPPSSIPPLPSQPTRGDRLDEMLLNHLQSRASDQPLSPQEIEAIIRQIELAEE
jgi:hypothetical protein